MDYNKLINKKCELDKYRPLPQALVKNLDNWFLVELTYTSNAIEGNTLTRAETALVIEKGLTVGGKSLKEHFEANNHAHALQWIRTLVSKTVQDIDEAIILQIHRYILEAIDDVNAGFYRNILVRISGSPVILPNPLKVPDLMADFIAWIHSSKQNPIELAALAHYKLVSIHPFVDGNGRTARLLMNLILMMHGYPPAIIRPEDRLAYIKSLESAQLGSSLDRYIALIARAIDQSLEIYLKAVKGEDASLSENASELLKIGHLASRTGIPVSTLRFWVQEELLAIKSTTPSGYWLFGSDAVTRIEEIKELQQNRFTVKEIRQKLRGPE
jgi:cell filamentation protein, protein adenylyltransferase